MITENLILPKIANRPRHIRLKKEVDDLLLIYRPLAVKNETLVINKVEEDMQLIIQKDAFREVIASILSVMSRYTRKSCLTISTKSYHDILLIHFHDNSIINMSRPMSELQWLQVFAERLGGSITVNGVAGGNATVTFSLLNKIESFQ